MIFYEERDIDGGDRCGNCEHWDRAADGWGDCLATYPMWAAGAGKQQWRGRAAHECRSYQRASGNTGLSPEKR